MTDPLNVTKDNAYLNELVTFIQHDVPGLAAGEYKLTVSQHVDDSHGASISGDTLQNSYKFAVLGDRFRLKKPAEVVYTVFQEDQGAGEYSTVLPHVVFTQSSFPWSRNLSSAKPKAPPPGTSTDANVPTWLAVLLLDEEDVAPYDLFKTGPNKEIRLEPKIATTGDLYPPGIVSTSSLGSNYSYFHSAKDTTGLGVGESITDPIQVLDIPLALFWKIAPTVADLALMAHVRKVSLVNKPTMAGISDVGEPVGTFSIVFGNRLPQAQRKSYAYLVSLEELDWCLPVDEEGGAPPDFPLDKSGFLRLAVLKYWTFFSVKGQPAGFVNRLLQLNGRQPGSELPAANTNLRLPYSGNNPVVCNALNLGYVPLNNQLRTGGKTVSWYRGPLVPYQPPRASITFPIASPDQATVFDPTTGMLDVSLAAAWTIGRLIALQEAAFSVPFYKWKKGLARSTVNAVEEDVMQEHFEPVFSTGPQPAALVMEETMPTSKALLHKLIRTLQPEGKRK